MRKYFVLTLAFMLFSFFAQAKPMLKGLNAQDFATYQTDLMKDKIELTPTQLTDIAKINIRYANEIYTLCDADLTYPEIKIKFYDLVEKKRAEITTLLTTEQKSPYSDLEDKFKLTTWNYIKKYLKERGIRK